jgi:hypothetical protein
MRGESIAKRHLEAWRQVCTASAFHYTRRALVHEECGRLTDLTKTLWLIRGLVSETLLEDQEPLQMNYRPEELTQSKSND